MNKRRQPENKAKSRSGYAQRKVNNREIRKVFLIVCEGTQTEPNYFRSFRVPKEVIEIKGIGKSPRQIIEEADSMNQNGDYDRVWCVFDRDSWTPAEFKQAIDLGKNKGFAIAYSNEAFELWYLLHFQFVNTGISRQQYKKKLDSLLGDSYQKNSDNMYERLQKNQATAIKNAEKLLKEYDIIDPTNNNPSTTVHLLVQELNQYIV
ncbi:RloB family protein [Planktothricoides raciborskii]|uniref:RloB domain-containing protein n=1 Tax=Planktothricoides raciborskii FACHB-1370 TaxID=2949576 RepID=A0ABR8EBY5_9CYAN|nr:RloB family protein [Planktothricoides raciborskii]MBD2543922.1 RloB domain-containing protein [Planktothricoides raciborskii FACHB-1370]MBD2582909.1 RloB domain-containing protein [Planktothricoides raciborskii FACHB-1261]